MWSRCPGSNRRPRPYQGRALPTELHRPSRFALRPTSRPQRSPTPGRQVGLNIPQPFGPPVATATIVPLSGLPDVAVSAANVWRSLERETGIEPATNSLEGCDSTTELLPPSRLARFAFRRYGGQARVTFPTVLPSAPRRSCSLPLACQPKLRSSAGAKVGGEGRIRTFEAAGATDLQSAAFDRFATSPK